MIFRRERLAAAAAVILTSVVGETWWLLGIEVRWGGRKGYPHLEREDFRVGDYVGVAGGVGLSGGHNRRI